MTLVGAQVLLASLVFTLTISSHGLQGLIGQDGAAEEAIGLPKHVHILAGWSLPLLLIWTKIVP